PAAAHAGGQGPGPRPDQFLRAARLDRAVAADRVAVAAQGMEAEPRRPPKARRSVRVYPVRLLLDRLPELLVEFRALSRPRRAPATPALAHRFARRGDRRAARQSGRP